MHHLSQSFVSTFLIVLSSGEKSDVADGAIVYFFFGNLRGESGQRALN